MFNIPNIAHLSWSSVGNVKSKIITKIDAKLIFKIEDEVKKSNPIPPRGSTNNVPHETILKG
jgi:hypothetical protein